MQQYNFSDIQAFLKVVETGSFTRAAEQLNASTAAVSRRVSALETALGVRLLNRTTRQLSLTDAGQQYSGDMQDVLTALEEAEQKVQRGKQDIKGNLRVAAPLSFGIKCIAPVLPGFLKKYPSLNIDLLLEDRRTDLFSEGIDLAIRIGTLQDSSLIATRIGDISMAFCASPEYLSRYGEPRHPSELNKHKVLRYNLISASDEWGGGQGKKENIALQWQLSANNGEVLREAAIQGLGVVMLPTFIVMDALRDGRLKEIMCKYTQDLIGIYAVRLSRQFTPAKISLLIQYMKDQIKNNSD
jgi:DNA-binding transcriptional LysR family regulator